ncbi:hypothetical protein HYC85_018335 [Camellia sinensis]|uniref:SUF system FeS cluster assembly SufBD N-terminal domain-containing protein n=1 Tax=Camellia sinensis TaxID=4442 RepID=A0A7J7GXX5_CAMSI|nr:hypothetical protein HYC85_018335 [Camellia sinensis]
MIEPKWSDNRYPLIDFQDSCYHSEPKKKPTLNSLDKVDPVLIRKFDELQIPVSEQKRLANVVVDGVLDSELEKVGVIFCSISEAIREYPDLVSKYFGKVVPFNDNYYTALNSAVFSDGSFCYIPKDAKCPMKFNLFLYKCSRNRAIREDTYSCC